MTTAKASLQLKRVGFGDLKSIIAGGFGDFAKAAPFDLLFGGAFAAGGWLLIALLVKFHLPFLAYPLAMGFALVAPFGAIAFYAVSDLLDRGEPLSFGSIVRRIAKAARGDLRWMSLVTGFALVIWMDIAAFIFFGFVGVKGFTPDFFVNLISSPSGAVFLVAGNAAGALIAVFVFSISVISFPMLFDRDIDFITAMTTSVRLVRENPAPMLLWCFLIGLSVAVSVATALIGLLVLLPVIGHTTWRLYRHALDGATAPI
ncbi:MAG: DUF2189 domain-containing protein [Pseudomonadota bacterium]